MTDATTYPKALTRSEFRVLIDPLLDALGFPAEKVTSCTFTGSEVTVTLFHEEPSLRRVLGFATNAAGERIGLGFAKVTLTVPVEDHDPLDGRERHEPKEHP